MAGPTFHYGEFNAVDTAFPSYYDNKVMIYEWMRNWVQVVTVETNGSVLKLDPFLVGNDYIRPMDIEVGPHGRLYILEWGDEFWGSNNNAQLVRLDYYGESTPPAPSMPSAPSASGVKITWPPNGGVFDFDQPVAFSVEVTDQAVADEVSVQIYTGFDTSPIPLESLSGLEGTFKVSRAYTHKPDVHYMDRFALLDACLGATCTHIKLQPRLKEAEHVVASEGSTRKTYSARPASEHWGGTALSVMPVENGSELSYAPVNLHGIDGLTLRFRATAPGRAHVRMAGSSVPLATLEVGPESGNPATPQQADYKSSVPPDAPGLSLLAKDAYDNWREITMPLPEFGGTATLVMSFESEAEKVFMELDWIRFEGAGIMQ